MSDGGFIMSQNLMQEQKRKMAEQYLKSFSRNAEAINQHMASTYNTVYEDDFIRTLLPIVRDWFSGRENRNVGLWLNNAGGMFKEIRVVDSDGHVVFFLPAAFINPPSVAMDITRDVSKRVSLSDLLQRQEIAARNGDGRTETLIEQSIPDVFDFEKDKDVLYNYLAKIYFIYNRYNLPLEEIFGDRVDQWQTAFDSKFNKVNNEVDEVVVEESVDTELEIDDYDF